MFICSLHCHHIMSGLLNLLRAKWSPPADPTTSFAGKTVLITGSNTGLGLEAARKFLALSAPQIILAVRSPSKGRHAAQSLEAGFPNLKKGTISVLPLDMNSYASIVAFVERVNSEFDRLDVVVLNAGLVNRTYRESPEGWEETLQVNTVSTALLALLLLPKLRAAKKDPLDLAHLVIVSSGNHARVKRSMLPSSSQNVLEVCSSYPDIYNGRRQYNVSKLFVMYVFRALTTLATSQGGEPQVIVTACCPGLCASDLARQYDAWYERAFAWLFLAVFARSQKEGSRTLVSAAALRVEGHGGYWKNDQLLR